MLSEFGLVGILLLISIAIPVGMLGLLFALTHLGVKPHHPNPVKNDTYECGVETIGGSWVRFNFRYYYYALLFVIFDVETVFLYPWAVRLKALKVFGFVEMLVFIGILLVGFAYAWRKKALEWK